MTKPLTTHVFFERKLAIAIRRVAVPPTKAGGMGWWAAAEYLYRLWWDKDLKASVMEVATKLNAQKHIQELMESHRLRSPFKAAKVPGRVVLESSKGDLRKAESLPIGGRNG